MAESKKVIPKFISDEELLEQYKSTGNQDCFGELFKRYTVLVIGVCIKYLNNVEEAEDAAQDIFIKKIIEKKTIQQVEIKNFKSWLHKITINHCLDILKSPKYLNRKSNADIEKLGESVDFSDYSRLDDILESDTKDQDEKLNECIEDLLYEQKECIRRFYYKKQSYKKISEETGFGLGQVRSYIQNGRKNLRIALEEIK